MHAMKVMTVVGTRPELIRLSRVIAKLDMFCEHILVHTGQNYDYELNEIFFSELGIPRPNYVLETAGNSAAETIGQVIIEVDRILAKENPEALLVLGDTNSCLAVIAAKRRKIPIFHMEAGNRCFDMRVPEEINRKIVDHVADMNLTYSTIARDYLLREGIPPDRVIKTGSPMYEVLTHYQPAIQASTVLDVLKLRKNNYFLVSCHREENIESERNFKRLSDSLNAIAEHYKLPVIVSTHPRARKRIDKEAVSFNPHIQFLKPLGFMDYVHLQMHARVVLSDSGTIYEEASILNFRALNIREAQERPEAMEETPVMMCGLDKQRVMQCIDILSHELSEDKRSFNIVADYDVLNVSDKVLRIIYSYTDYIRQTVWKQY